MQGISYAERDALGRCIPANGQAAVMAQLPQFSQAALHLSGSTPQDVPDMLKIAVFNMERGMRFDAAVEFLQDCPALQGTDIMLANELDNGCIRSGCRDVTAEIAGVLGMNAVYGLEFIELANPNDPKGFHGNAIFSRWPVAWAKVLRLPEEHNWYFDHRQSRIGGRLAIFALLEIGGRELGVVCVHLENRTDGAGRERQMKAILEYAEELFPSQPVVIGGDFNTNTFDGRDVPAFLQIFEELKNGAPPREVAEYEPLLPLAERYGYDYRSVNVIPAVTRRKPMHNAAQEVFGLQLDWLFVRGLQGAEKGVVSTQICDCTWKRPDGALSHCTAEELSDHNALWLRCRL